MKIETDRLILRDEYPDSKNEISYDDSITRSQWTKHKTENIVTKEQFKEALVKLGIHAGMTLEVHSSLSSFGNLEGGLDYAINNGGKALLFGVDIYKLTAMHYMEGATPEEINQMYEPSAAIREIYPEDKWFIEAGHPPVKAWYTIQKLAYERGLITDLYIGDCKVMYFDIMDVVSIYRDELEKNPYELWGLNNH